MHTFARQVGLTIADPRVDSTSQEASSEPEELSSSATLVTESVPPKVAETEELPVMSTTTETSLPQVKQRRSWCVEHPFQCAGLAAAVTFGAMHAHTLLKGNGNT